MIERSKFKVGDVVEVISDEMWAIPVGTIFTIEEIKIACTSPGNCKEYVVVPNGTGWADHRFKLVKQAQVPEDTNLQLRSLEFENAYLRKLLRQNGVDI